MAGINEAKADAKLIIQTGIIGDHKRFEHLLNFLKSHSKNDPEAAELLQKLEPFQQRRTDNPRPAFTQSQVRGSEPAIDDIRQLHKDAQKALQQNLSQGEVVRVIIKGPWDQAMIGTDFRLFVFKKGLMGGVVFGTKMASWDYKNLTGVQIETGVSSGLVALQGAGIISENMSYWNTGDRGPQESPFAIPLVRENFEQAKTRVPILRDLIHKAQQSQAVQSPSSDIPAQISKLSELKDRGILSMEEFETKKKELLSRM
jgi:hypothetical protein